MIFLKKRIAERYQIALEGLLMPGRRSSPALVFPGSSWAHPAEVLLWTHIHFQLSNLKNKQTNHKTLKLQYTQKPLTH